MNKTWKTILKVISYVIAHDTYQVPVTSGDVDFQKQLTNKREGSHRDVRVLSFSSNDLSCTCREGKVVPCKA